MACKSRLRRAFPGPAIRITNTIFADAAFREPLAEMLVKLDLETPTDVAPYYHDNQIQFYGLRESPIH
jgi:hypothetical protein